MGHRKTERIKVCLAGWQVGKTHYLPNTRTCLAGWQYPPLKGGTCQPTKPGTRHNKRFAERALMFPTKISMTYDNATQRPQERELDRLADDTAATDGRNTEPLDAVGGARGMMETKVGSPGACRSVPDQPKP